jgi:pSer/pThr/pTyr-binding forkhead associated (FHA) protein
VILRDERAGLEHRIGEGGARLGRDPDLEIVFPESEDVVSSRHCRVVLKDGLWWLEDLGSTNGTWLDGKRLSEPARLGTGKIFTLGQRGPALRVTIPGELAKTKAEPAVDLGGPVLRLRRVKGGEDLIGMGAEVFIGRSSACAIPLRSVADTVVSKRHAVVTFDKNGAATIRDLGSRNGTFLNGKPVRAPTPLALGDRINLGWEGPLFEVRTLGQAIMSDAQGAPYQPRREPPRTLSGMVAVAEEQARRAGGMRAGIFVRAMVRQLATTSSVAFRATTLVLFAGLVAAVIFVYHSAAERTARAEARLTTAEHAFTAQMQAVQQHSSEEIARLRKDLAAARRSSVSRAVLDSLQRRLREAESLATAPQAPSAPGVAPHDFTDVARESGRAVGLVIVRFATDSIMGSGFAITPSGYFVTNRHVVMDDARGTPRQISVVMAETNIALSAEIASVSSAERQDVAVLRIRGYHGPVMRAIDWVGRGAIQGAPAVILGFPFGTQLAADQGGYLHSTLFAGYIAQTGEYIRFSGNTYLGVSGSPVFNTRGEVIGVHYGAPREGPGLGISVPMSKVARWLPAAAKAELGL